MIDFSTVIGVALGVEEVIQIEDSLGTVLWQKAQPVVADYFYIEDTSGNGSTLSITKYGSAPSIEPYVSTDGTNWTSLGATSSTPVTASVPANGKLYIKCTTGRWAYSNWDVSENKTNRISVSDDFNIGGNIMSLLNGDNFENTSYTSSNPSAFAFVLWGQTHLLDASDLELPNNTTGYCYCSLFSGCTNLTAPPVLPATSVGVGSYQGMFQGCSSLTQAPALNAMILDVAAYQEMFRYCTALTIPPVLPATTLNQRQAYSDMFNGCTSLNKMYVYADTITGQNAITNWLANVAATGDFYNLGSYTYTIDSPSGIPVGWTEHHSLPVPCNVSISSNGNGTVSVNGVSGDYSDTVISDTVLTIAATADNGYYFTGWSDGNTSASRTITVNSDLTLTASFAQAVTANYFYVEDISGNGSTLKIRKNYSDAPTIEVFSSTDQINWSSMGNTGITDITANVPANGKLYLKATANQWGNSTTRYNYIYTTQGNFNVGGNIMSLLYGDNYDGAILDSNYQYQFNSLFTGCTTIIDASDLELPNNVTNQCYDSMFKGCSSLTTAPALPATTLASSCYQNMFNGCSSLTTAPALPATTLASSCYRQMFPGCTALTSVPALSATTLATNCYQNMFNGCTSLTTAPALPATTLADYCYQYMFHSCTSLTTAPALPATTLATNCYQNMFNGCTSLTTAPALPATTLTQYCYSGMFNGCPSLTTAPALPATTLAMACYSGMFNGCSSLTTAPALPATTLASSCYQNMFNGCPSLTTAPALPATTLTQYCYDSMFNGCPSLTTAPALPATTLASSCYRQMFNGCTSLTTAPTLPATTLANQCYQSMFQSCTSLTTAPALPATTLASSCYRQMFNGCSSLNKVYTNADDISASNCITNWLQNVAATGDFYALGSANWTIDSPSGVPVGWTLHQAYAVSVSAGSNGIVSVNGVSGDYSENVMSGTQLTLVATPNTDYVFDSWSDGDTNASRTITVSGAVTLTASFVQAQPVGEPFYIEDASGSNNTVSIKLSASQGTPVEFFSSTDNTNWTSMGTTAYGTPLTATVPANGKLYLKANPSNHTLGTAATGNIINCSGDYNVGGYVDSLLEGDNYVNNRLYTSLGNSQWYHLHFLFKDDTHLLSATNLVMPTNTGSACYVSMFWNCTSLISAPATLPATTLSPTCYQSMFMDCTSLINPPSLPATTLANGCYWEMFQRCTALTQAPVLPATTLTDTCYEYMFNHCTSLNSVTTYADDISANNCTNYWLNDVAATGDFYNLGTATYPSGASGIPSGWTEHTSL